MSKTILSGTDARAKLQVGVDKLANAVGVTLGPKGQHVGFSRPWGGPAVTKDGYTVSTQVQLDDAIEQMGADILRYAASKTVAQAGDGTTSSTILGQKMIREGLLNMAAGANAADLKRGMDLAVDETVENIKRLSLTLKSKDPDGKTVIDWDKVTEIGTISANNDREIGELISSIMYKIGPEGAIVLEEGRALETTHDIIAGYQYNQGLVSYKFVNSEADASCTFLNPLILLYTGKLNSFNPLEPIYQKLVSINTLPPDAVHPCKNRPLVVICAGAADIAVEYMLRNYQIKTPVGTILQPAVLVKAPGFGDRQIEYLKDLQAVTGARIVSEEHGHKLEAVVLEDLGSCAKIVSTARDTTIFGGAGKPKMIEDRCGEIQNEITNAKDDYEFDRASERLAKLSGGIGTIKAGGATEIEMKAKKALIEDALRATRAAIEEGVVPGGGTAYLRLADMLGVGMKWETSTVTLPDGEKRDVTKGKLEPTNHLSGDILTGYNIIKKALEYPCWLIAENAGFPNCSGDVVVNEVRKSSLGFNAQTGVYEDLVESGVIDPSKVVRCAIVNAASVAGVLLTTGATIGETYELQKQPIR